MGKDKEKIASWIREWFPLEFDHVFIAYLPNRNKKGRPIKIGTWEKKALQLQAGMFGGATSYPASGSYRRRSGKGIILEGTKLVTSFVMDKDLTEQALKEVTDFLKEFGKKTDQETVAFVLDGEMYWIEI